MKSMNCFIPPTASPWAHDLCRVRHAVPIQLKQELFPSGEWRLFLPQALSPEKENVVASDVREVPTSLSELVLMAHALHAMSGESPALIAPWIAYGRQDRPMPNGELPIGLAVGKMLSDAFKRVITFDAHSPAFVRSFHRKLVNIDPWEQKGIADLAPSATSLIVAPDHGAKERARAISRIMRIPFIVLEKKRSEKGVNVDVPARHPKLKNATVLIVDDMMDRGTTLMEAAGCLRRHDVSAVHAMVTHGIRTSPYLSAVPPSLDDMTILYDHASGILHPILKDVLMSHI